MHTKKIALLWNKFSPSNFNFFIALVVQKSCQVCKCEWGTLWEERLSSFFEIFHYLNKTYSLYFLFPLIKHFFSSVKTELDVHDEMKDNKDSEVNESNKSKKSDVDTNDDKSRSSEDKSSVAGECRENRMEEVPSPSAGHHSLGVDEDEDDYDKREGAESDGGLGDDEDDEKTDEPSNKRKKIEKVSTSSNDGKYFCCQRYFTELVQDFLLFCKLTVIHFF